MSRLAVAWSVAVGATVAWALVAAVVAPGTPLTAFVTVLTVAFGTGVLLTGRVRAVAVLALVVGTLTAQVSATYRTDVGDSGLSATFLTPLVIVLAPVLAGALVGRARRQAAELRRLTAELAAEREAHAAAAAQEERNRIARELHDVISHSVSQMVVQAGAAEQLLPPGEPARAALQTIRVTGRQALTELRDQLGVLREGPDAVPVPVPTLADVRALARGEVALEYDVDAIGHVAAGPGLAAYRVVQEALTNARRHAQGAPVWVRIGREDDRLAVDVVNAPGYRHADTSLPGPGHGLTGMRERVELYAGELDTGRTDDGGWRVCARLPLEALA